MRFITMHTIGPQRTPICDLFRLSLVHDHGGRTALEFDADVRFSRRGRGVELYRHERRLGLTPRHVDSRLDRVGAGQPLTALLDPVAQTGSH